MEFDRANRHLTAYLCGEIDVVVVRAIEDAVLDHHRPTDERLWLDFAAVTFCDSTGVRMLLRLQQAIATSGTLLTVYDPPPMLRELLKLADPAASLKVRTGTRPATQLAGEG